VARSFGDVCGISDFVNAGNSCNCNFRLINSVLQHELIRVGTEYCL
jgi:hypothetical protein